MKISFNIILSGNDCLDEKIRQKVKENDKLVKSLLHSVLFDIQKAFDFDINDDISIVGFQINRVETENATDKISNSENIEKVE